MRRACNKPHNLDRSSSKIKFNNAFITVILEEFCNHCFYSFWQRNLSDKQVGTLFFNSLIHETVDFEWSNILTLLCYLIIICKKCFLLFVEHNVLMYDQPDSLSHSMQTDPLVNQINKCVACLIHKSVKSDAILDWINRKRKAIVKRVDINMHLWLKDVSLQRQEGIERFNTWNRIYFNNDSKICLQRN